MSFTKAKVIIVLDVGKTMTEGIVESKTKFSSKFQLGLSFIKFQILQAMMATKTAEFGLVTMGSLKSCNDMNYQDIEEVLRIGRTSPSTVMTLENIEPNPHSTGSLVNSLDVALDQLSRVKQNKTDNRIIFIITDGESPIDRFDYLETNIMENVTSQGCSLFFTILQKVLKFDNFNIIAPIINCNLLIC
jgi:hypothetical protein